MSLYKIVIRPLDAYYPYDVRDFVSYLDVLFNVLHLFVRVARLVRCAFTDCFLKCCYGMKGIENKQKEKNKIKKKPPRIEEKKKQNDRMRMCGVDRRREDGYLLLETYVQFMRRFAIATCKRENIVFIGRKR